MLVKDPAQRMTLQDVLGDAWLRLEPDDLVNTDPTAFDATTTYDTITVSNDEIYKSIRELKGRQSTHAETSFETVDENGNNTGGESDGGGTPLSSSAVPKSTTPSSGGPLRSGTHHHKR